MKNTFTDRLKVLRGNRSQAVFAKENGLIQQTYANWESGLREPNIEKIKKLAHHNGVTTDWLLGYSDERPTDLKAHDPPGIEIDREDVKVLIATNAKLVDRLLALCPDGHGEKGGDHAGDGGARATKTA